MRRHLLWLPLAASVSCAGPLERPAPMEFHIRSPELDLGRITSDYHLRIFPRGGLTCDPATGHILNGSARATTEVGGGTVRPDIRCGSSWETRQQEFGVAQPTDLCIAHDTGRAMVSLPAGTYLVLIEGSGQFTGAGGTTELGILGSGCTESTLTAGQTASVNIVLQEQREITGACGDRTVGSNEMCDEGPMGSDNCTAQCNFPERVVNTSATGSSKHRPAIAWTPGQPLLVAFDNSDDVFVHQFDLVGLPITSPNAFNNDLALDITPMSQQSGPRIASASNGWAASWESIERTGSDFDVESVANAGFGLPPGAADISVNATSRNPGSSRRNAAVGVSATRVVWVFEDQGSSTLRVASTAFSGTLAAPADDAPLVTSGLGMASAASPRVAAVADGFVVAWAAGATGNRDIYAMRLDAMGAPMGAPIVVNTQTGGDQLEPALASNGGDIVVAWRDNSQTGDDTMGAAVRWRHLSNALVPDGAERLGPSTVAGDQTSPTIAISSGGIVLVAWADTSGDVRARLFRATGEALINRVNVTPNDFRVNAAPDETTHGAGPRILPQGAFGGMGRFAVAWEDQNSGGAGRAQIHFRTLLEQ